MDRSDGSHSTNYLLRNFGTQLPASMATFSAISQMSRPRDRSVPSVPQVNLLMDLACRYSSVNVWRDISICSACQSSAWPQGTATEMLLRRHSIRRHFMTESIV